MGCRELPSIDPRPTEGRLSSPRYDRTLALASIAFALLLAPLLGALAQDASKPDATFNERYPGQQPSAQGAPDQNVRQRAPESAPRTAAVNGERNLATPVRVASTKRPRTRACARCHGAGDKLLSLAGLHRISETEKAAPLF